MKARYAGLLVAACEMKSVSNSFAKRVSIHDQRNIDRMDDTCRLLNLLRLRQNADIGHGVMHGSASRASQIGHLESDVLHDAGGECAVDIGRDEFLASVQQFSKCLRLRSHVDALEFCQ